jgi:Thrombospondin type 1 domain
MKQYRALAIFSLVALLLVSYNFMSAQWTAAPSPAPGNNTPAPINVGPTTQAKSGNLMANVIAAATSTWSPEYCDELGANCWDPSTGAPGGGGGDDTITIGGQCFEPAWAVTCNWNWSGDGNDNSTYIAPFYLNPTTQVCATYNRSYQYHNLVLAECTSNSGPVTYSWSVSAWNACYASQTCTTSGSQSRTVTCRDSNGFIAPDSSCSGPKPTTSQSCVAPRRGSDC